MGTMGDNHEAMVGNGELMQAALLERKINLKLISGVQGHAEACKLVAINLSDIVVKRSWIGPGRLHLVPHVKAPVADFPMPHVLGTHHFLADLTLPYGHLVCVYRQADHVGEAAE